MLTGELRNKVDEIWETFWTGGITNPLSVIEQFTYLLFIKGLDEVETTKENENVLLGIDDYKRIFPQEQQHLRWSKFKHMEAQQMFDIVSNDVFPFIKNLHGNKESAFPASCNPSSHNDNTSGEFCSKAISCFLQHLS